jgi:hypothetical protein
MAIYTVDERDKVRPLEGLPKSSPGAPCPVVISDESRLFVAYYVHRVEPGWDDTSVRIVGPDTKGERVAVVTFASYYAYYAYMFGPPNDEAFHGHPLASRGLGPYRGYVVEESSWVRRLERLNSVHSNHSPEAFKTLVHYVLAFHDSTFECVSSSVPTAEVRSASMRAVAAEVGQRLG